MAAPAEAIGGIHVEGDQEWYRIDGVDLLDPFLVNVVSPGDHWMFVSSSGALTAGRHRADHALFPYETDDRLHRSGGRSGPVTIVRCGDDVWEPLAPHAPIGVQRSLAKTVEGDRLRFAERHQGLGLTFRSTWATSRQHGLVRLCELELDRDRAASAFELLDGLLDVLPAGVELGLQQTASTLVDAYRRAELEQASSLAVFSLEAAISDQPLAAESMTANVVWSRGLDHPTIALSDRQLRAFRSGHDLVAEPLVTGAKSAFLQSTTVHLEPGERTSWVVVGDVALGHARVADLQGWLLDAADPVAEVEAGLAASRRTLVDLVAEQDALQRSADHDADVHHFANVVYNAMRGGAFTRDHLVEVAAVQQSIEVRNRAAGERFARRADGLQPELHVDELRRTVQDDPDLLRLVNEFLPLTFSRRHGDPSRPWNRFEIRVADRAAAYEGNWRDIFQNWEALLHSFPDYLESAVSKFLSASTRDGHNPYRINQDGIDWEVPEGGSWSNFGYWGDHQVVYLQRLLEAMDRFHPGWLESHLAQRAYAHADVPYRIRPHAWVVKDPKRTLEFDLDRQHEVERREARIGTDGRLVADADGHVHLASLAEKLLIPALAKVANLVPGGGIWMNTQRPEWNDANNALVGNGLSVVTAFHLRDHLAFLLELFGRAELEVVPLDPAVDGWLRATADVLAANARLLDPSAVDPRGRRGLLDGLRLAYDEYRERVESGPPAEPVAVAVADVRSVLATALAHVEVVTSTARRDDGLVESYRLLVLGDGTAEVRQLYPMLEGQVAAIGSPATSLSDAADLAEALFASGLYREDHGSFVLHPNRRLPSFLERNRVPDQLLTDGLLALVEAGEGPLRRDGQGVARFDAEVANADDLERLLHGTDLDASIRSELLTVHEAVFEHRAFTGRSQSMYRYEGLGSIYWHMVAKLLDAVQRRLLEALAQQDGVEARDREAVDRLRRAHGRIAAGFGHRRPVAQQGAFPLDPHSHTPAQAGAQQPGMTGAVKEGILVRFAELGVSVRDGCVRFAPRLLDEGVFLLAPTRWPPLGDAGHLPAGTIGFTWCGVPVVYHLAVQPWIRVTGPALDQEVDGEVLDLTTSRLVMARGGAVSRIDVGVRPSTERH